MAGMDGAVLGLVPFLGGGIKAMALARFSLALEALLNAGVDTPKAWSSAAYASGSPMLAREMKSFGSAMERGRTPSEWLQEARFSQICSRCPMPLASCPGKWTRTFSV